jgi:hypothetical protein
MHYEDKSKPITPEGSLLDLTIGQTGTGKSTLIETLAEQDLHSGQGFALVDPHGDLVERVWDAAPQRRREHIYYLNAPDLAQPLGATRSCTGRQDCAGGPPKYGRAI